MKTSIAIVGGNDTGRAIAAYAATRDWADLVIIGPEAEQLAGDLRAAAAVTRSAATVRAAGDPAAASGSAIVVLADDSADLEQLATRCPDAIVIVAGERTLERTAEVLAATIFPRQRVIGLAGEPHAARLRALAAANRGRAADSIDLRVLGAPDRAPLLLGEAAPTANGPQPQLGPIVLGASCVALADAIVADAGRVLVCAVRCEGEYGIEGVTCVPVVIGANGVERIIELALADAQLAELRATAI